MSTLSSQLPVLPVLLPAATAIVLLMLGDNDGSGHDHPRLRWARAVALASTALGGVIALLLALQADTGVLAVYRLGDWPAPFGIVLVVDRLAALMLLLSAAVALPVLLYASGGWDAHGRHFHALFQFQLMGLNGAFLTGDLFNLFVFFEVLLIASYVLMMHGGGPQRLRVGLHYVVLNLVASALFLVGAALVYGVTGTLNFTDLALRAPQVPPADAALLQAGALLLLVVFGFKAALAPLSLWLPATYAASSAPVAALFAIMTKVGVYAILRVHGVALEGMAVPLLLPLALVTCIVGVLGALAAATLQRLVAWLTVASVGTILAAVGLAGPAAWSAAMVYLVHSTLVVAGLFLLAELVAAQRGDVGGLLQPAAPLAQPTLLGLLLLLAAASSAGLPPLPGFIGKVMLLQAAWGHAWAVAVWVVVLAVGFCTLVGLARAGSVLFWKLLPDTPVVAAGASPRLLAATVSLLAGGVLLSVLAAPLTAYTDAAARQLGDTAAYARAVLPELGAERAVSTQPYTGRRPAAQAPGAVPLPAAAAPTRGASQ